MKNLVVDIYSFGYHFSGTPEDISDNKGGFVFDCRCLPNPGRLRQFSDLTGKDIDVINYLNRFPEVEQFLVHIKFIIDLAVKNYSERKFEHLMISFGCTGGQHRSVYCAEQLFHYLKEKNIRVNIHHIEQEKK